MRQQSLFPSSSSIASPQSSVPGLVVRHEYIQQAQEEMLLAQIEPGPWEADFRRRNQQYGLGYGGTEERSGELSWVRDFPPWLAELAQRITSDGFLPRFPENCVINDYAPGVGIGPHRDYPPFGSVIAAVSLLSDVIIDFERPDKSVRIPVLVPARSLWVASGEARWKWTHGIAPRLSDVVDGEKRKRGRRISLTFRIAKDPSLVRRGATGGVLNQKS
jgi:alkylated DNA repair dioxygenase AlkB